MKKLMILSSLLCVTMIAAAQLTGTSQITLKSAGQSDKVVRFVMSNAYSDEVDPSADVEAANPGGIYVYKASDGSRWTQWASNAYSNNIAIGFKADDNLSYKLNFSAFSGLEYSIYDVVAKQTIDVKNTTEYNFEIDESLKNATINNRFIINYVPVTPAGDFEICHIGNELTIANNPYPGNIVIKNAAGQTKINVEPAPSIDLSGLEAGRYTVEIGDKHLVIIIK